MSVLVVTAPCIEYLVQLPPFRQSPQTMIEMTSLFLIMLLQTEIRVCRRSQRPCYRGMCRWRALKLPRGILHPPSEVFYRDSLIEKSLLNDNTGSGVHQMLIEIPSTGGSSSSYWKTSCPEENGQLYLNNLDMDDELHA